VVGSFKICIQKFKNSIFTHPLTIQIPDLYEEPLPSTSNSINALKQIYTTCMDVASINSKKSSEFLAAVEGFGFWPIIHGVAAEENATTNGSTSGKWQAKRFNLTRLMIDIGLSRAVDVFIDVYVSLDQRNVDRRLLHFDQGSVGLGASARDYYLNATKYVRQMAAYEKFMFEKLRLLKEDSMGGENLTEADEERLRVDVKELIEFEKQFAKILVAEDDRRNFTKMYNLMRLSDMQVGVWEAG